MEWQEIAPSLTAQMQQNPRMNDAAVRATQLGELGNLGLNALSQLNPNNPALHGTVRGATQITVIDDAAKPAALVRFTFLDSLRKLVTASSPAGAIH
jgi:hexosaminidase